jgi:serine/threonine-protein kinase
MAEVFLAKVAGPAGFEKTLVVKRILPHLVARESFVEMFLAEARIAAQLSHQNIVQIYDFGEEDGAYFISMEFIDGLNLRTLSRWLTKTGPITPALAARIIIEACEGLAYAHEFVNTATGERLGLVHRDISPENLMLTRTGGVKVLDFGIARVHGEDNGTHAGVLKGKIAYMPVEQLGAEPLDGRADVYALGVVLYQLLSGHRPWEKSNDIALAMSILNDPPTPLTHWLPDASPSLVNIIERATARKRDDRFADCRALQQSLEKFIASTGAVVSTADLARLAAKALELEDERVRLGTASSDSLSGNSSSGASGPGAEDSGDEVSGVSLAIDFGANELATPAQRKAPSPASVTPPAAAPPPWTDDAPTTPDLFPAGSAIAAAAASLKAPARSSPPRAPSPSAPPPPAASPASAPRTRGATSSSGTHAQFVPRVMPAGLEDAYVLNHTRKVVAPMALLSALRDQAAADRASQVLARFPAIAAQLMEQAVTLRPRLVDQVAALVDAALVADDHGRLAKLVESSDAQSGGYAATLRAELMQPLRVLWLVERLRLGLPPSGNGLVTWLGRLGPPMVPLLLAAIDASESGAAQNVFARALGLALNGAIGPVVERLEVQSPKNAAALCCALEVSGAVERKSVFQRLLGRRDVELTLQVMTGRAMAGGAEVLALLEAALGDREERVRVHAASLISSSGDPRLLQSMLSQVSQSAFDKRTDEERTAWWVAILSTLNATSALGAAAEQLEQKTTLFARKRSVAVKLAVVAGLKAAGSEGARLLLERTAANAAQPDEVVEAARAALVPVPVVPPSDRMSMEQRGQLRRMLVLDLALLTRAMTVVDAASGLLDTAMERLRATLRAIVLQDGKLEVLVKPEGVAVNDYIVSLRLTSSADQTDDHAPAVAAVLRARDLQRLALEAPLPIAELRGFLLHWFDPDAAGTRAPRVRVETFSGRTSSRVPPPIINTVALSFDAWKSAFEFVLAQQAELAVGRAPSVSSLDPFFENWSWVYLGGSGQVLSVVPTRRDDDGFAVHAANTACIAMAFASDLELGRSTIREVGEFALCRVLSEYGLPAAQRPAPGEAAPPELRLSLASLALGQIPHRRAASYAVAAYDLDVRSASTRHGGVVSTIVALADAWDAVAIRGGLGHPKALEQLNTRLRQRFMPELLDVFLRWGQAQLLAAR